MEELKTFIEKDVVCPNVFIISSGLLSSPVCMLGHEIENVNVRVIIFTSKAKMSEPLMIEYPGLVHKIVT
jgi:hypothetical protein